MKIDGRFIIYPNHKIELIGKFDPDFAKEYIAEMAEGLDPNGSADDHKEELEMMNNDGSWIVHPL